MTHDERNQFLDAIANIDLQIDTTTLAADDAPAVAQTGNLAKAVLLLTNVLLYQQDPPACILCNRPATVRAADLDLCEPCDNAISEPDPALDESWGEYLADVVESLI